MRAYIREHLKTIICVTALLVCTGLFFATNEIIAKIQPVISEELEVVYYELEKEVYDYTGEEVKPEIERVIFENEDNERTIKSAGEFRIVKYNDNIEVGQADIEIALDDYQGTIVIKNAFRIQPAQAGGLQITSATREAIDLSWGETAGADGYALYKSVDGGKKYARIYQIKSDEALSYQDTDIQLNAVYMYYVCAYELMSGDQVFGSPSEKIKHYTPLENPTISAVKHTSYNTLQIQWPAVDGAAGYQVYRSDKQNGEYKCIAEIKDGATTSYNDATCECGKIYYYYIKVCQITDVDTIYGEASPIVSGKTTPNKTSLNGKTSDNDTKVTLTWKKVSGAQGYEVYKNNKLVKTIESADTLSWTEAGLSKEAEAGYKVRAYCVVNNEKIYGSYSGTYEKEITIVYDYGQVSSDVSALTQYAGYRYVYGGTSPTKGWDCSGFTQYVFKKHFGISLSRTSGQQAGGGTAVSKSNRSAWKPGDLLFYKENGRISHVAIYLGNGQMIHALSSRYDTLIQSVDYYEKWDSKTSLYCVRRYF